MFIQVYVTHPAYTERGHEETLLLWARDLALLDMVPLRASTGPKMDSFVSDLGFKSIRAIKEEGDDEDPKGARGMIIEFRPDSD